MRLTGTAAAPGVAVAPIWRYVTSQATAAATPEGARPTDEPPSYGGAADLRTHVEALSEGRPHWPHQPVEVGVAAHEAATQLEALAARVRALGRHEDAGIFEAQAMMAEDPGLLDDVQRRVAAGDDLVKAVQGAAAAMAEVLASLDDELLAARAADVRDVGARIARVITGEMLKLPDVPSVAVADDLPPSVTAEIPPGLLVGIALEGGSRTAHAVILARGLGIPAIVGVDGLIANIEREDARSSAPLVVALDGQTGEMILGPTDAERREFAERSMALAARSAAAAGLRGRPCATRDGQRVMLVANIGGPEDAPRAIEMAAEGVGLFRTEFVFMGHQTPPTEREQVEAYRRVFEAFGPDRPVVVRLADIGGDKAIPYLNLAPEANPFLGVRAIRLAYRNRELLVTQLRAISRAAALAGVVPHVMAPMVATLEDIGLFDSLRDEAQAGLAAEGAPRAERMVSGIMVEIPSAALLARELAPRVEFFSIGTNDLTQYTLAADRGNAALDSLQDALHPAVLRLIRLVVEGADASGIPVAVCGELAGDPAGALVLLGIGVDELSADAGSLDAVRLAIANVTRAELDELGRAAVAARDAAEVRELARALLERPAPSPATA